MIRLLKPLAARLWLAFLVSIVIAGVLIGAARLLLPRVSEYRGELEAMVSEQLGRPVHIGGLGASWHGLGPRLVLQDVTLADPRSGETALALARVELGLAWRESLRAWALRPGRVTLVGAALLVKRRSDGSIAIEGLEDLGHKGTEGKARGVRLPALVGLRDSVIEWQNLAIGGRPMRFDQVDLTLLSDGQHHQLDASLRTPGESGGRIQLAADLVGQPDHPRGWVADVYLAGERLPLSRLLRDRLPKTYAFDSGAVDLRTWSRWEGGRLAAVTGRVDLDQVALRELTRGRELGLARAGGRFRWRRTPGGWRLDTAGVQLERLGRRWPETRFSLASELDTGGRVRVRFGADFLRIEDLLTLTRMFPLPDTRLTQALAVAEPAGDLRDLALSYAETDAEPHWSLRGRVDHLSVHPWERLPGVSQLDARFWIDQTRGCVNLDGEDLLVDLPRLFRWPLVLEQLDGTLDWQRVAEGWRIESSDIRAISPGIRTRSRLRLDLPGHAEVSPWLDLQVDFSDGRGARANRYYPVGVMSPKLVAWLDRAIVNGRITSGSALLRGTLRDFPFHRSNNGRFEVLFGVQGLVLDYHTEWPRLEEVNADVAFVNNTFDARIYQGYLFQSQVAEARAHLDSLRPTSRLHVTGSVRSSVGDNLRLLRETALAHSFREMTRGLTGEGPTRVDIDLSLPVSRKTKAPLKLAGSVHFDQSRLALPEWDLDLRKLRGRLDFTETAVSAKGIQARAFASPVLLDVATETDGRPLTRVLAKARLDREVLLDRAPPARFLRPEGAADWILELDIPHKFGGLPRPPRLILQSDLDGLSLGVPAPLGKTAGEKRPLSVSLDLTDGADYPLELSYDGLVDARLLLAPRPRGDPKVLKGGIRLGGGQAELPAREGLMIRGRVPRLDLAPWLGLAKRAEQAGGESTPIAVNGLDLEVEDLHLGDTLDLGQVALDISPSAEGWSGAVDGTYFNGFLSIPRNLEVAPIKARLGTMHLNLSHKDLPASEQQESGPSLVDPRGLPGLDLDVTSLEMNGKDLGQMSLRTERVPEGVKLSHMKIDSKQLQLLASGGWIRAGGADPVSKLDFTLETKQLGELLSVLGFDQTVEGRDARLEATLEWPGSPIDMRQKALSGELSMTIGAGRFLELDPGVGRVFGLLSLGTLQRRLSLNFSDLVDKGLSFDKVQGDFRFDEGDAYTQNLMIRGPSARIEIAGRIGLMRRDFAQEVTVTPEFSSSLPVAGALAGGPAVGAALLVADRLVGERVNRMGSARYEVSGPWADPHIEKLQRNAGSRAEAEVGPGKPRGAAPATIR